MSNHQHSQKCRAHRLLFLILPSKAARRIFPSTPPTSPITAISHPSESRATHHLDTSKVLHGYCVSPPPISMDGPFVLSRSTHQDDTSDTLRVSPSVSQPPSSLYGSWSRGIHHLDTSNVLHSTHPISLYGPWSRATHHLDSTFNTLHGYRVSTSPISIDDLDRLGEGSIVPAPAAKPV
ncbi:hypothetical protein BJV77DRAFT_63331 [Russula vinacea]|nr:hypothetical protein BJV77DRAFT_63331 [Russula vinacea]